MALYRLIWTNGNADEFCDTVDTAKALVQRVHPDAYIHQCPDDRWLAWCNEAESEDDDGARAVAEIQEDV